MKQMIFMGFALTLVCALASCGNDDAADDTESAADTDTDTDTDADTDSDTDSDSDSDTDTETDTGPGECPINTGYPCTCEASVKTCDDGTPCIVPAGYKDYGVCALECNGMAQNALCQANSGGWGSSAACMFAAGGVIGQGMGENCAILCLWKGVSGACPPDQECLPTIMPGADICLPAL